jgi:dihydroorotate dehydrogenase
MSWLYRRLIRPVLFTQDAEEAHERTMRALSWASRSEVLSDVLATFFGAPELPLEAFGVKFPNPVGVAAGMDKEARAVPIWEALGFGFTELGAVTWQPQPGNPAPRLFRAVSDEAIVNRMGFNNPGAQAVAETLAGWRSRGRWPPHPVGINLGKSKATPLAQAAEDYARSFDALWPHVDFFVINVSSPNTPNLRQLQDKAALDEILTAIQEVQRRRMTDGKSAALGVPPLGGSQEAQSRRAASGNPAASPPKPVLVKVAPDLSFEALDEILELAGPRQISGLVATNTTITRPATEDAALQRIYAEAGGLSGRPLRARSTEVVRHLYRQTRGSLPIIGVGGIFNDADAWEKITAGASLIQLYTGMVYEGPGTARAIVSGLIRRLAEAGLQELRQAVGTAA